MTRNGVRDPVAICVAQFDEHLPRVGLGIGASRNVPESVAGSHDRPLVVDSDSPRPTTDAYRDARRCQDRPAKRRFIEDAANCG